MGSVNKKAVSSALTFLVRGGTEVSTMATILLIDDDVSIQDTLKLLLRNAGHVVHTALTGNAGLEAFHQKQPDIIFLDVRLPDRDGLEILCEIQAEQRPAKVIIMTAYHDMQTTIWAMKNGAYDYIRKPWENETVTRVVEQALAVLHAEQEKPLIEVFQKPASIEELVGESEPMLEIVKMVGMLCRNRAPVLIEGETGSGKDVIARMIHQFSSSKDEPFVVLDCSSVVDTLIESELFGYERGAFTGANRTQPGKIEAAGNGTLFLDEIGELPSALQGKLLGFLQRHEYMRVGGHRMLHANCRVLAATNRNLADMVKQGHFKKDLYYRLHVVCAHVPSLRERRSDIPLLVHHFIEKINQDLQTGITTMQDGVIERLMEHPWTGNVRELENTLVEACVRARGQVILVDAIDAILNRHQQSLSRTITSEELVELEKTHIKKVLSETHGNISEASRRLGISRPTLRRKIRKYVIEH